MGVCCQAVTWSYLGLEDSLTWLGGDCGQAGLLWVSVMVTLSDDRALSKHRRCNGLNYVSFLPCLRRKQKTPRAMDTPAVGEEGQFWAKTTLCFTHSVLPNQESFLLSLGWFVAGLRAWPITVPAC